MTRPIAFAPSIPTRYDPILGIRVPVLNLQSAADYGELRLLIPPGTEPLATKDRLALVKEGLRDITKADYVVCIGDPILIAAAIAYATGINGSVNALRWNKQDRGYDAVEVVL